jgi:hypothetical protein
MAKDGHETKEIIMRTVRPKRMPTYYFAAIANELQDIADGIGANPNLSRDLAARLHELAQQMREDNSLISRTDMIRYH